jgi:hypothetical protein
MGAGTGSAITGSKRVKLSLARDEKTPGEAHSDAGGLLNEDLIATPR